MYIFAALIYPSLTAVCLLIALFSFLWYRKQLKVLTMTTETSGVINKLIEPKPNPKNPGAELYYRMWIEYSVDGKTYKTYMYREASKASYQEGQEVTVIYDPDKPSRAVAKDFENAKNQWLILPVSFGAIAAVFLLIAIHSLPDVLNMSSRNETIFGIVFNFCISAGIIAGMLVFSRSGYYRREKEKNPKSTKGMLASAVLIIGNFLFDAIFDLVFYVILK